MKALTIKQPWAELIASGRKRVENRTWKTNYRGRLAIHAGAAKVPAHLRGYDLDEAKLDFGAVIATANLIACVSLDDTDPWNEFSWLRNDVYAEGPWCWVLADVKRLRKPAPAKGKLGFWEWTP